MTPERITELLAPFEITLEESRLQQISVHIDLLIRWNARINLTAIRDPEEIVTRHFGESLFTAKHLFPNPTPVGAEPLLSLSKDVPTCPTTDQAVREQSPGGPRRSKAPYLIDVGSGAGFPGLPIKIWNPDLRVTLIESNQKKATFLREIIRALTLTDVNIFSGRAETYPSVTADVVTLRGVERFDQSLPVAAQLVAPGGSMALLIGSAQVDQANRLSPNFDWKPPISIPSSQASVLLVGTKNPD